MIQVRAPTQSPLAPPHRELYILFLHPGYDDSNNVLFKLHAPDTDEDGRPGLFAQFAVDACAIVAGDYAGQGWLSLLRDGSAPIDPASTLRERSYYFHLDAADSPYAIVPNFRQWSYPHNRLPLHWQQLAPNSNAVSSGIPLAPSNLTTALLMRDGSCRLSGCREELQVAHVVPQSEYGWWKANDMARYNKGSSTTLDNAANALLLRADLHIAFDRPRVALVPKPAADGSMRLVAHLLEYSPEFEHLYHNRELHPAAIGVDMLYARFAWSVFTLLDEFLECGVDRRLTLRAPDAHLANARGFVAAVDCELFSTAAARKRLQSPKKRKPVRETVTELEKTAATPARISRKRKSTVQGGGILSVDVQAKRACQDPALSASAFEEASSSSPLTPTHPPTDSSLSQLSPCLSLPPPAPPLTQAWLENERQRSDPGGIWNKEQNWAREVWDGKTLAADEVGRWFEANGIEVRDV